MIDEAKNNIPIDLISRCLAGEATSEEMTALENWVESSKENEQLYSDYLKLWEKTGVLQGKPFLNIDDEWNTFNQKVQEEEKNNLFKNFLAGPKFFTSFYRMAAVVLFGLLAGYSIYFFSNRFSTQSYFAETAGQEVRLPDGTSVILNAGAEIRYPGKFSSGSRLVEFSGEGFFHVKKDPDHPFIIRTKDLSIRVLGTSFNVKAEKDSPDIEVTVNTGTVALYKGSDRKNEKQISVGEKAIYFSKLGKIETAKNNNPNYLAWRTGKMDFKESTLTEVLSVFSSAYHKKFIITSENIKNCRLTANFENQGLESALKVLEATLDIHFKISGETIEVSGQGC
ncbi:MAG: FecR domain-containing protein [Bacteroidales bacterium]|nr:FecR domain-containing protein [Bacteroidales bacterium]MCB9013921.1 FecR domain-containing protein [Bacteroidales bacterium]